MVKIAVHFNQTVTRLNAPADDLENETWGQVCQRFCESSLLHIRPPKLLQLLTSLHPDNRMPNYQFRYGDGSATIFRPTWSEDGYNSSVDIVVLDREEESETGEDDNNNMVVDVNAILRPRGESSPCGGVYMPTAKCSDAQLEDEEEEVEVDLWIERILSVKDAERLNGIFATTQVPFPTDDAKTHVLNIKEHEKFEGVVDKFSVEKLKNDEETVKAAKKAKLLASKKQKPSATTKAAAKKSNAKDNASDKKKKAASKPDAATEKTEEAPASKKKRKKAASTSKKSPVEKALSEEKEEEDESDRKSPPEKDAAVEEKKPEAASKEKKTPARKKKAEKKAATAKKAAAEKKAEAEPKKSPAKKRQKKSVEDDVKKEGAVAEETKTPARQKKTAAEKKATTAKKAVEKSPAKKAAAKKVAAETPEKAAKAEPKNSLAKKRQKKTVDEAEHAESPKKKRAKKTKKDDDESNNEEGDDSKPAAKEESKATTKKKKKEKEENKIKRPGNAYMRFSSEVRASVVEKHPDLKFTEIGKKIGALYRDLSDEDKNRYAADAKEALAKFHAEHPELGKKNKAKKDKKRKKADDDDDDKEEGVGDAENEGTDVKDKPKKPVNAYILFSNAIRSKIKKENPDVKSKEIMSKIGAAYRDLDDDEKKSYKVKADKAMADFKKEYGGDALKKKPKKSKNKTPSKKRESLGTDLSHIPTKPAEGLPDGWTTRSVPRKTGGRSDLYWFSPTKEFKFRSKADVKRFQETLENANGDEVAAIEVYSKMDHKSGAAASGGGSAKKSTKASAEKEEVVAEDGRNGYSSSEESDEVKEEVVAEDGRNDYSSSEESDEVPEAWAA